jgi:hypothetical protein
MDEQEKQKLQQILNIVFDKMSNEDLREVLSRLEDLKQAEQDA